MILALDATMSAIGAALFDEEGNLHGLSCIKPEKKLETPEERELSMGRQLGELIKKHDVTEIAVEVSKGYVRNINAAKSLYKSEGGVLFLSGLFDIKYHAINIYDVKEEAVNRKTDVDKHQMIAAALKLEPTPPLSRKKDGTIHLGKAEHEADAIFVGRVFFRQRKYREAIKKQVDMMLK